MLTRAFEDDPWRRLPWMLPCGAALSTLAVLGFLHLVTATSPRPVEFLSLDVQVLEGPAAGGASGPRADEAPSPPTPPTASPTKRHELPSPKPAPPKPPAADATSTARSASAPAVGGPADSGTASPDGTPGLATGAPTAGGGGASSGVAGGTMSARALYKPSPEFPEELRRKALDAVAVARFHVAVDGATAVELLESTSEPVLNRILLETLRRWRFFPAMEAGKPVPSTIDVRIPISVQ